MSTPILPQATTLAHQLIAARVSSGDRALDATAGNGHDTVFLCALVGEEGQVHAVDLQVEAIEATQDRVGPVPQLTLELGDHSSMRECPFEHCEAAMLNLGYLPGGDKCITTTPQSTVAALDRISEMLEPRGILTITVYTGHPGGEEEAEAVRDWAEALDQHHFAVARYEFLNQRNPPPHLIAVERR
ncbi:MAG: class I SAM-dependent methyltransferase [Verrucomicrobiota bacterium]